MARRKIGIAVAVLAAASLFGGAAYALAVGLSPTEGDPGATYQATIGCSSEPTVKVRHLDPNYTQATLPPESGIETSPGVWTYSLTAGSVDDLVFSSCGDDTGEARFDVDKPVLYLGPIPKSYPEGSALRTTIEGSDCPAGTEATVRIVGADQRLTLTRPIDERGDWTTPIPAFVQDSDLTVTASCGSVTYAALTVARRPGATSSSSTTTTTTTTAPTAAAPAVPVAASPGLTG